MAGRGPASKGTRSRERDQRRLDADLTVVRADGDVHGPELPEAFDWPAQTCEWWATWRESAQASSFTDTDWSFLLDTAKLHAEFWLGDQRVAAELRLRVAKFGATPEDRARLKIEVGDAPASVPTRRTPKARRDRLLKAVGGDEAEA